MIEDEDLNIANLIASKAEIEAQIEDTKPLAIPNPAPATASARHVATTMQDLMGHIKGVKVLQPEALSAAEAELSTLLHVLNAPESDADEEMEGSARKGKRIRAKTTVVDVLNSAAASASEATGSSTALTGSAPEEL